MVGRNDPCPCGSGKKYKKCCGKEEAVDLQQVVDAELEGILREFAEEGLEPKEFYQLKQRVTEWQSVLSNVFDRDMVESLAFESFIFHDRVDIWQDYIGRKKKSQKRQRVLDVLELWNEPFFLLAEVKGVEDGILQMHDKVTGKSHRMSNIGEAEPGDWLFGIVMQSLRDGKPILHPAEGLVSIPDFQQNLVEELAARLKGGISESLELYRPFVESIPDLGLSPFQEEVMALIAGFIAEYEVEEEMVIALAFKFLTDVPVNARKPQGVAAGILQMANDLGLFGDLYVTQQALAKRMGTSVATLSKYADIVDEYVMGQVELQGDTEQPPGMPTVITDIGTDPRITEQNLWEMVQFTKNARSEAEVNRILQQPNKKYKPENDVERAQMLCYEAFEESGKERERLARKAYNLDPKNGDANLLMAEFVDHPAEKRIHYLTAINTGYRSFDDSFEMAWGYVLNRPFLRALFSYSAWLMEQEEYEAAIEQLTELMDKNPGDHQGGKWLLASAYIRTGEWEEAEDLLDRYEANGHTGLGFFFNYLFDLRDGILDSAGLKEMKQEIKKRNPHLVTLMKEGKKTSAFPRRLSLQDGSKDEAELVYWLIYGIQEAEVFIE